MNLQTNFIEEAIIDNGHLETTTAFGEVSLESMERKLENLLKRSRDVNASVLNRIDDDGINLKDSLVKFGRYDNPFRVDSGRVLFNVNGEKYFHKKAEAQVCERLGLPGKYVRFLKGKSWGEMLLEDNLNELARNYGNKLLFRSIGEEVRGVVSNSFRRMDSRVLLGSFMRKAREIGAVVYNAEYDGIKVWVEVVLPYVVPIETKHNGRVFSLFGARLRNSDFGGSKLEVNVFQLNLVCANGMTGESMLSQVHLGRRFESLTLSDRTYQLDTQTQASAIEDIVGSSLSKDVIIGVGKKIQKSGEELIDVDGRLKSLKKSLREEEVEAVKTLMIESDPMKGMEGRPTDWKLSQAITWVANDREKEIERRKELQDLAGSFILK